MTNRTFGNSHCGCKPLLRYVGLSVLCDCTVCLPCAPQKVCIQEDGVHLTPEGQKVMYNSIINTIETKLPQIRCVKHAGHWQTTLPQGLPF